MQESTGGPVRPGIGLRTLASLRRWWPVLLLLGIAVAGWGELRRIDVNEIRSALHNLDPQWLVLAGALTLVNLALLGCYDLITLAGTPVPRRVRWGMGAVAFAWSNFFTLGPIAGPAVRFWLYRKYEMEPRVLRGAIVAGMMAFAAGLGVTLVTSNLLPAAWILPASAALLVLLAVVLGRLEAAGRVPWWLRRGTTRWTALFLVALLDWALAAFVFVAVLKATSEPFEVLEVVRTFLSGQTVGALSLLPGGIGSADAWWLVRLPMPEASIGAALVAYRAIYYLAPWLGACVVLLRYGSRAGARWLNPMPTVLALLVGAAGMVLLVSTASPGIERRLQILKRFVPLEVVEVSHLVGAVAGLGLLLLARGVARGYREAHRLTVTVLLAGALAAALKGLDYEEMVVLLILAGVVGSQSAGFRRSGRATWVGWTALALTASALGIFALIGFRSYPSTADYNALWWTFGFGQHAEQVARFLRTLAFLALSGTAFLMWIGFRSPAAFRTPRKEEIDRALEIHAAHGEGTSALIVAAGDKSIFFYGDRGFCSYRVVGSYLVVFSDPTVPRGEEREFLEALSEHADDLDRRLIFYQVASPWLPVLHDYGYSFFKLGEEAILPLHEFTLTGGTWKPLRQAVRRIEEREGFRFSVLSGAGLAARLPELRRVSDEWLQGKVGREKQFSIGAWSEPYLLRFPCAVIENEVGKAVAFANLLCGPGRGELSIDLMRQTKDAPEGVMDYLFTRLLEWGKNEGYRYFSFGMAPLAAVGELSGARVWERLAHLVFRHGEGLYNFQGLRAYKAKFNPQWVPRYMAYPEAWEWPFAAVQVSVLIAGGWRSVLRPGRTAA